MFDPFVIKFFVMSIFEWSFYTGFTVDKIHWEHDVYCLSAIPVLLEQLFGGCLAVTISSDDRQCSAGRCCWRRELEPSLQHLSAQLIWYISLWVCHFPIGILGQVWYLIVSIPDLCTLTYFDIFLCINMGCKCKILHVIVCIW